MSAQTSLKTVFEDWGPLLESEGQGPETKKRLFEMVSLKLQPLLPVFFYAISDSMDAAVLEVNSLL